MDGEIEMIVIGVLTLSLISFSMLFQRFYSKKK